MKNVVRISCRSSRSRMRGTATAPNSPRESAATLPSAISKTHGESASKSNVKQIDSGTARLSPVPARLKAAPAHDGSAQNPSGRDPQDLTCARPAEPEVGDVQEAVRTDRHPGRERQPGCERRGLSEEIDSDDLPRSQLCRPGRTRRRQRLEHVQVPPDVGVESE